MQVIIVYISKVQVPPSVNFLLDGQPSDPRIPTTPQGALCKQNLEPNGNSQNKDQVNRVELLRGHKIKEILSFEKEYVKRLRDVVEVGIVIFVIYHYIISFNCNRVNTGLLNSRMW